MSDNLPTNGVELMKEFLKHSPFAVHVGLELTHIEPDRVVMTLPFAASVVTVGDVIHGGAISTLIDVAATAASFSGAELSGTPRGATVGLSVDFLRAARGRAVEATARVLRRGSSLCFCDVDVTDADGELVAKGLVTYKVG